MRTTDMFPPFDNEAHWARRIYPYYKIFRNLKRSERRFYIAEARHRIPLSENTIQRQLAALLFVETQGADPENLSPAVSMTALESAAKAMAIDPERGRALLRRVLGGKLTARGAVSEYKKILARDPELPEYLEGRVSLPRGGNVRDSSALASINLDLHHRNHSTAHPQEPKETPPNPAAPYPASAAPSMKSALSEHSEHMANLPRLDIPTAIRHLAEIVHNDWARQTVTLLFDGPALTEQWHPSAGLFRPLIRMDAADRHCGSIFVFDSAMQTHAEAPYAFIASIACALLECDRVQVFHSTTQPFFMEAIGKLGATAGNRLSAKPFHSITHGSFGLGVEKTIYRSIYDLIDDM